MNFAAITRRIRQCESEVPAQLVLEYAIKEAVEAERERICAAIKAEDDHCADGDYMMDSDDCIKVVRGTWERPDWNGSNVEFSGGAPLHGAASAGTQG